MVADISKTGSNLSRKRAIVESVMNLLQMRRYERFFDRGQFCRIDDILFQNTASFVGTRVITSELTYMIKKMLGSEIDEVKISTQMNEDKREYKIKIALGLDGETVGIDHSYTVGKEA